MPDTYLQQPPLSSSEENSTPLSIKCDARYDALVPGLGSWTSLT
jgi:hypothetical protein